MSVITYIAKRNVMPSHTEGNEYIIEVPMVAIDRRVNAIRYTHKSLTGVRETWLHRLDKLVDLTTKYLAPGDLVTPDHLREFLESVAGGEEFTIDLYGTINNPRNPLSAVMESANYREQRRSTTDEIAFSFQIEVNE